MDDMEGRRLWCESRVERTLGTVRCMRVIEKEICAWVWEMMNGDRHAVLRKM